MTGLIASGITAAHGKTEVLHGLDLTAERGQVTCLLGPSGCGKTTLLRVLAGFHRATQGAVRLEDQLLDDGSQHVPTDLRRIGYVPQDGALFPHLSVARNIGFGLRRPEREDKVAALLDLVGLRSMADRLPHQLSGGQQQRVALARALSRDPVLLLLDEPFAALDPLLRTELRAQVVELVRRTNAALVLVTHDREEALDIADSIAVVEAGQVLQQDPPLVLFNEPRSEAVAMALGECNMLPATVSAGIATTAFGTTRVRAIDGPVLLMCRPHELSIVSTGNDAVITAVKMRAGQLLISLTPQRPELADVLISCTTLTGLEVGQHVGVRLPERTHTMAR